MARTGIGVADGQSANDAPGGGFGQLLLENSTLNLTALKMFMSHLSPHDMELLLKKLNVDSIDELLDQTSNDLHEKTYEEQLMEYQDYRLRKILLLYIPPILVILGSFGNILSFIILMRRSMRKFSTYVYLAVLSITDTLILLIGLLPLWVGELTGIIMRDQSDWICKLTNVAGYTASDYSVWLIIAVTVERYIAVCYPLKAHTMCNRTRAITVIIGMLLALFAINLHFFWTVEIHEYHQNGYTVNQCEGAPNFTQLVEDIWPWVDAFLYSFLPFVVISVFNYLIIRQVIKARRDRKRMLTNVASDKRSNRVQETSMRLTIMLLTISFAFLLTTLPMNISSIGSAFYNQYQNELEFVARYKLLQTVTELLMYVNHSMNFYLYCATGQKFRQQLILLFCHRWAYVNQNTMLDKAKVTVVHSKPMATKSAKRNTKISLKSDRKIQQYSPPKNSFLKFKDGEEYIPMKINRK